jgi:hypothetical protein
VGEESGSFRRVGDGDNGAVWLDAVVVWTKTLFRLECWDLWENGGGVWGRRDVSYCSIHWYCCLLLFLLCYVVVVLSDCLLNDLDVM